MSDSHHEVASATGVHTAHGGHEMTDVQPRAPIIFIAGLFVMTVATLLGAAWLYGALAKVDDRQDVLPTPLSREATPPGPRIVEWTPAEREDLSAAQRQRLSGYHWADQQHTAVQIPIERAMDVLVERGSVKGAKSDQDKSDDGKQDQEKSNGNEKSPALKPPRDDKLDTQGSKR